MMEEHQWSPEELQALALLGLEITPHSDPANGWGYAWQERDWSGPFPTPDAAIHAAFAEARQALQFKSEYASVTSAQPGERREFKGESRIQAGERPQNRARRDIETSDVEEQARQDWSNDE